MKKIQLKINGMHCSSCSMRIDGDLEEVDGVKTSQTNFAKGLTEVEFDESKVSTETLAKVITTAGYSVQS